MIDQGSMLIVTVLVNGVVSGLVTWGVVKTELAYLRRDVDHAHKRADDVDARLRDIERGAR